MLAAEGNPEFYALDPSWAPDRNSVWHTKAGAEKFGTADPGSRQEAARRVRLQGRDLALADLEGFLSGALSAGAHRAAATRGIRDQDRSSGDAGRGFRADAHRSPTSSTSSRASCRPMSIRSSFPISTPAIPVSGAIRARRSWSRSWRPTTDPKARVEIWKQIQTLIYEQAPYIKFGTEASFEALRKGVSGSPIARRSARLSTTSRRPPNDMSAAATFGPGRRRVRSLARRLVATPAAVAAIVILAGLVVRRRRSALADQRLAAADRSRASSAFAARQHLDGHRPSRPRHVRDRSLRRSHLADRRRSRHGDRHGRGDRARASLRVLSSRRRGPDAHCRRADGLSRHRARDRGGRLYRAQRDDGGSRAFAGSR